MPCLSKEDLSFIASTRSSKEKIIAGRTQKFMELMINLVFKFCNAKKPVAKKLADNLMTAKPCLKQPEHCSLPFIRKNPYVLRMRYYDHCK